VRIIGLDVHRGFAVAVFLDGGKMLHGGRVELTRDAVIAFGRQLRRDDDVVIEATVNSQHRALAGTIRAPGGDRQPTASACDRAREDQDR
jgi:hypothetical protein